MSNPKTRDLPKNGPSRSSAMKPRIDPQHTSKDAVLNETALDFLRKKSQAGITGYHARILKIENDPSKFDLNHHGEMTDALSGQPPIRYKVSIEDESGALFPEPETYGETPEDSLLIDSLPDFSLSNADIPALSAGDTVNVKFQNTITRQGGTVESKVSKFPDGSGTIKSNQRKLNKPSSNFADKRPVENKNASNVARDPKVLPSDLISSNTIPLEDYKKIFPQASDENVEIYRSHFENARKNFNIYEVGSLAFYFSNISVLSSDLSNIQDPDYVNKSLLEYTAEKDIFHGRTFFYKYINNKFIYAVLSDSLLFDFIKKPEALLTPQMCVNACFDIMTTIGIGIMGKTWNIDAACKKMLYIAGSAEENKFKNSCNNIFEILKKHV